MATEIVDFATTLREFGLGEGWTWNKGSWWLEASESVDVRATTTKMIQLQSRFVAISAIELADKSIRLNYQWDLDGKLLSFACATSGGQIATISDLCPAADWVERETHEYFSVDFTGRKSTLPLMTRAGDQLGINLHKEVAL
jgi:NADH:ubiquinone oxidoreductase subunit C